MFDPLRVEALGDHYDTPLDIEAQSHLGTTLVVLFPDGYKKLVLQQGRTLHIHPKPHTGDNTNDASIENIYMHRYCFV